MLFIVASESVFIFAPELVLRITASELVLFIVAPESILLIIAPTSALFVVTPELAANSVGCFHSLCRFLNSIYWR